MPFLDKVIADLKEFNDLFELYAALFNSKTADQAEPISTNPDDILKVGENIELIRLSIMWLTFRKNKLKSFDVILDVRCLFEDSQYKIVYSLNGNTNSLDKLYNEGITTEEQDKIISDLGKQLVETIESNLKAK